MQPRITRATLNAITAGPIRLTKRLLPLPQSRYSSVKTARDPGLRRSELPASTENSTSTSVAQGEKAAKRLRKRYKALRPVESLAKNKTYKASHIRNAKSRSSVYRKVRTSGQREGKSSIRDEIGSGHPGWKRLISGSRYRPHSSQRSKGRGKRHSKNVRESEEPDLLGSSKAATLVEAQSILGSPSLSRINLKTTGQPYSLPEPRKFVRKTRVGLRNMYDRMTYAEMPAATWYAGGAVRPLLLTFDAFGTLFTPKQPIERQYCEVAQEYSLSLNEDDVKTSFETAYRAQLAAHPNYGKTTGLDPERWWTQVIKATITSLLPEEQGIPHGLTQTLYWRFASREGYTMYEDAVDLLTLIGTSFQASNWPPRRTMLGIISNSDPRVASILESFGIQIYPSMFPPRYTPESIKQRPDFGPAHFAFAALSYVHGTSKPSTELYTWALRDAQRALDGLHIAARLTRSGNEILDNINKDFHHMHVGDDWDKDIVPAVKLGFDAVLIDRSIKKRISERDLDGQKITVINDLTVIKELLTEERTKKQPHHDERRPVPRQVRPYRNTYGRSLKPHPGFDGDSNIMTLA